MRHTSRTENVRLSCRVALVVAGLIGPLSLAAMASTAPKRIVSLNLCTDQILVDLVAPERIRALSHLSADPRVSSIARRAGTMTRVRGEAEEVLALDPDLIVTTEHSTPATVALLERLGRRVVRIPFAQDLNGVRVAISMLAQATSATDAGKAILSALDRRLAAAAAGVPTGWMPTAVIYQINSLASGNGTLDAAALTLAGFDNLAPRLGLGAGGRLALEALVAHPPDLLVLSAPVGEYRTIVAENLDHPALRVAMRGRDTIVLPWRLWLCGTHHIATAVETLATARRKLERTGPRS